MYESCHLVPDLIVERNTSTLAATISSVSPQSPLWRMGTTSTTKHSKQEVIMGSLSQMSLSKTFIVALLLIG
jgi:hypothetical protein